MNGSALPAAHAATAAAAAPPPSLSTLADQAGSVPLTRVSLAYIEPRFKLYLRFGEPARTLRLDRWRRCAVFLPRAMFCRVRWEANDYGTIRWQLMVMQAATPLDDMQRIPGVRPGARLLLHAEGENAVPAVLERIDGIEGQGIAAIDVSPAYWRTLGNRLAAAALPEYTAERHAAGWPERRCHDDPIQHHMHARSRAASSLAPAPFASCWRASLPSASLRWHGRLSCRRCRV